MVVGLESARETLRRLRARMGARDAAARMAPKRATAARLRVSRRADSRSIDRLWSQLEGQADAAPTTREALCDPTTRRDAPRYAANIERMIGSVKVPVGVVGPLQVNGLHASGAFYVPLATTEAALVASYARGADLITEAGGAEAAVLGRTVMRAPAYLFASIFEAGAFVEWIGENEPALRAAAEATTRHGRLVALRPHIVGETVFLVCDYTTGDAAGQNMVTIATDALMGAVADRCPISPRYAFLEANFSGDKKASFLALIGGRGRKATARVHLPGKLIERRLHTGVERMLAYARVANLGALASGTIGAHGHVANGLAALFIATGQDAACVAESSVGFLSMEGEAGGLTFSLTLPDLCVGTVGGGTGLPSQSAALDLLGLKGAGHADAFAEVAVALCLAGEISIIGALAAGHFARAHQRLARGRV